MLVIIIIVIIIIIIIIPAFIVDFAVWAYL